MSNIKSKRSAIPGRVPTIDQLELGELALNTFDGRLFLKKNSDGVEEIVTLQAQKDATFARLDAGYGMLPATYNGTSDVTFNVDPREININNLGGTQTFIQNIDINQLSGSNTFIASANNGVDPGSYAITGSNVFRGHEVISGSILITSTVATVFNIVLIEATSSATPAPTPSPTPAPSVPSPSATPNPTPMPTPTPVASPVLPPVTPVPEIYLGSATCRQSNCGDGGPCAVNIRIEVYNFPAGSYVDAYSTGGGGSVSMVDTTPGNALFTYYEDSSAVSSTSVKLFLRSSVGVVLATRNVSISHSPNWSTLPLC
jgi:hypothetical protein